MADETRKSKAQIDLEAARTAVGKIAFVEEQTRSLLDVDTPRTATIGREESSEETPKASPEEAGVSESGSVDDQADGLPTATPPISEPSHTLDGNTAVSAPAEPLVAAPPAAAPAAAPSSYVEQPQIPVQQPGQYGVQGQQGYWQGFVPIEAPSAPGMQQMPMPYGMQPTQPPQQPVVPMQPAQQQGVPVQQSMVPGQQPAIPVQQPVVPGQQPAVPIQPGQQPAVPLQQPMAPLQQHGASMQPTTPGQPTAPGQPAQYRQATPAAFPQQGQAPQDAYNQAYTPQIQQPSPYVSAHDFTVQPQPDTPAYAKSNKSTLAIVLAVVIGVIAIIAAIAIGRVLSTSGSNDSSMIDQLTSIEQEITHGGADNQDETGSYPDPPSNSSDGNYSDHNWGSGTTPEGGSSNSNNQGSDSSSGNAPGATGGDSSDDNVWGWTDPNHDWGSSNNGEGALGEHGAIHIYGGGIDADDGELHDAWNSNVPYSYTSAKYDEKGISQIDFYGKTVAYSFDVDYPQFEGDIPNLDIINNAIKEAALYTVNAVYTNPTEDAKIMFDAYAQADAYSGIPSGTDGLLESKVDFAITYNNNDFASICFSDEYAIGSWYGEYISLRTVNVNLKTGEFYTIDDVLTVNEEIAGAYIDNVSKYDNGSAIRIVGREGLIDALMGKGDNADRVSTTFFVDGNGKVNLGVTYQLGSEEGTLRGWWDYTLTDEQLQAAKKDSSIWDVLQQG